MGPPPTGGASFTAPLRVSTVAPNPDQACAASFGNTDTMTAAVTY